MEEGASGSSWHPALMPNSAATSHVHSSTPRDEAQAKPDNTHSKPAADDAPDSTENAADEHDMGDAWLEDADDDVDAWLASDEPTDEVPSRPVVTEQAELLQEPAEDASTPKESTEKDEPQKATINTSEPREQMSQNGTDDVDPSDPWLAEDEPLPDTSAAPPADMSPLDAALDDVEESDAWLTSEPPAAVPEPAKEHLEPDSVLAETEPSDAWLTSDGPADHAQAETEDHVDVDTENSVARPMSEAPTAAPEPANETFAQNSTAADSEPSDAWLATDRPEDQAREAPVAHDGNDTDGANAWLTSEDPEHTTQSQPAVDGPGKLMSEVHEPSDWPITEVPEGDSPRVQEDATNINANEGTTSQAWLASDAPAEEPGLPENAFGSEEMAQPLPSSLDETKVSQSNAQHSSSMSFARTVSHEISFNDDDDGDWNLSRTDTDPFNFMPRSDRTNSFPAVPPAKPQDSEAADQPLPRAQALDVLEEADKDATDGFDTEAVPQEPKAFWDEEEEAQVPRPTHGASKSIGGTVGDAATEASQARYEEGLPLIPRATDEEAHSPGDTSGAPAPFESSFGDDDGDDFFSQIPQPANESERISPVERKSTMHFLQPMSSETAAGAPGLDNVQEDTWDLGDNSGETAPPVDDLASKWQEAFGGDDDDDFLLEDQDTAGQEFDAAGFLGSDDEGLLEDDEVPEPSPAPQQPAAIKQAPAANPYAPPNVINTPQAPTQPASFGYASTPTTFPATAGYAPTTQTRPSMPKAESFADKAKGGYASPYDLPTDLVSMNIKPRKRASMQQLVQDHTPAQPPPPRSVSGYTPDHGPPSAPPTAAPGQQPRVPKPLGRSDSSFFEDLPVTAKPRPSSRQSARAPSPAKQQGPPSSTPPSANPPANMHVNADVSGNMGLHSAPSSGSSSFSNLVAPEKVNPYASIQPSSQAVPPPSGNATRYSPAPAQQAKSGSAPPPAVSNRFSPAPPSRQNSSQSPPAHASASQTYLPHLPRTSSPLAHFEIHNGKASHAGHDAAQPERRASSTYEPKLNRVASLPPTREVDEEDDEAQMSQRSPPPAAEARYSPAAARPDSTPPPNAAAHHAAPQKRAGSNYLPHSASANPSYATPPPRAQTQSPGTARNIQNVQNVHPPAQGYAPGGRQRGPSLSMNLVPPTDGRENDPLKRWQGTPIISWGVGGTMVTSFPKSIPRYSMNQTTPTMLRTAGEVRVKSIKDIEQLDEHLAKFPGPLRGKSKKKDALLWLASGIEKLEKEMPDVSLHQHLSLEAKRSIERVILWKLLRVFVEFDGRLEGTTAVDTAVQQVLTPKDQASGPSGDAMFQSGQSLGAASSSVTAMQADMVDSASMERIRRDLLKGDREAAVWTAVDKRLWGHAMLISQTISPDLYKRVAQEFVRKEVNYPGHSNESLGAFYKVLSGNYDDCVDELVPVHARAGLQLMSTEASGNSRRDVMEGLDKWRETVSLILSNRSKDDIQGLHSMGKLLSSYGRAEAAQICFLFSRAISVFGGLDDPKADFVLLGADHHKQSDQFAKETEALQLSEVYEYGLTLSGAVNFAAGAPHLAAYKLQHAVVLAENGHRDKALQYCDAIIAAITAQTRRSPYHHSILEGAVDNFMRRLKQAPKEDAAGWMSKPNMNKVSDSMWNRFNKFVSGDEDKEGGHGDGEHGPFARIASTPNISRSPSVSNFETYGGGSPNYAGSTVPPPMPSTASSRYAPAVTPGAVASNPYEYGMQQNYAPQPASTGRSSNEYAARPYEPTFAANSAGSEYPGVSHYEQPQGAASAGYGGSSSAYQPQTANYEPQGLQESPSIVPEPAAQETSQYTGFQPSGYAAPAPQFTPMDEGAAVGEQNGETGGGFEPPSMQPYGYEPPTRQTSSFEPPDTQSTGYEAPATQSHGYEPPSYNPNVDDGDEDEAPKPKKKSFMDDDEDDIPGLKPAAKSQAELDRENQEMFRKAAEEDGKCNLLQITT